MVFQWACVKAHPSYCCELGAYFYQPQPWFPEPSPSLAWSSVSQEFEIGAFPSTTSTHRTKWCCRWHGETESWESFWSYFLRYRLPLRLINCSRMILLDQPSLGLSWSRFVSSVSLSLMALFVTKKTKKFTK